LLFTANSSLATGVFFAFLGGAPYVSERMLHLTPGVYGLWFAVAPVGYATGNFISGRFTERFGVAQMILAGSTLALIAAVLPGIFFISGLGSAAALFLPMMLIGLANGLSLPSAISGAISVHPEIAGAAAGLSGAAQIGMGALLSAFVGAAFGAGSSPTPMFVLMSLAALLGLAVAAAIFLTNRPGRAIP
jgi:DHA1 family bicyclomycin/chloramphenicol resistance-like MFS transporter